MTGRVGCATETARDRRRRRGSYRGSSRRDVNGSPVRGRCDRRPTPHQEEAWPTRRTSGLAVSLVSLFSCSLFMDPLATAGPLLGCVLEPAIPFAVPYRAGLSPAVRTRPTELRDNPAPGAFSLPGSVAAKAQWREDKCATVNVLVHSRASVRMILAPSGSSPLGASSLPAIDLGLASRDLSHRSPDRHRVERYPGALSPTASKAPRSVLPCHRECVRVDRLSRLELEGRRNPRRI
jgi:hypothetical protein